MICEIEKEMSSAWDLAPEARKYQTEINKMMHELSTKKENLIREQLQDLITDGIIVIEQDQPVVVQVPGEENRIEFRQLVRLRCRYQEVINELKEKVRHLENLLAAVRGVLDPSE